MPFPAFTIQRIAGPALPTNILDQIDAIFFGGSGCSLAAGTERTAFRERWLGRYLQGGSDVVLVALEDGATVAGYLVGALDDPSLQARFSDISYFRDDFRELCRSYPAHLHVNVAPAFRGRKLGTLLVDTFAKHARIAGAPGMHVVTAREARSASFYARCGFAKLGTTTWNDRELVFLGRSLATPS